jgi:hypothetical protein
MIQSLMDGISESWEQKKKDKLIDVFSVLGPTVSNGLWINACSGVGIPVTEIGYGFGIETIIHIDQSLDWKLKYEMYMRIRHPETYPQHMFINDNLENAVKPTHPHYWQLEQEPAAGILLLHPPGGHSVFEATFKLAHALLLQDASLVTMTDKEDEQMLRLYSARFRFRRDNATEALLKPELHHRTYIYKKKSQKTK